MSNPNNCETCDYTALNGNREGHCYMFRDAPTDVCKVHSGREVIGPLALLDALQDRAVVSGKPVIEKCVRLTLNLKSERGEPL